MCLLGHAGNFPGSELQLHQVRVAEGLRGNDASWREFSDGHSDFVACVAPGTANAVLCQFVLEGVTVGDAEVEVFEEGWDAGEETDALNSAGVGLIEEGADQEASGSLSLDVGMDNDRADLGKVWAVDVE